MRATARLAVLAAVLVSSGAFFAQTAAQPAAQPGAPSAQAAEPATGPIVNQQQMEAAFDEFFKLGLDLEKPLAVHGLAIKRDTMELTLADGTIYLAQPVAGPDQPTTADEFTPCRTPSIASRCGQHLRQATREQIPRRCFGRRTAPNADPAAGPGTRGPTIRAPPERPAADRFHSVDLQMDWTTW
jgi:hypothetical protein